MLEVKIIDRLTVYYVNIRITFNVIVIAYPKVTVKPTVKTGLDIQHGLGGFQNKYNYTFERVQFKCVAGNLLPKYSCNVRWYINDFIIDTATKKDVQANKLGNVLLHQSEWDNKFKPPMRVSIIM
jgi:hypothetical protein